MKAPLTRGIAVSLNLTLAGLAWWRWVALVSDKDGFKGCTKDLASCILLAGFTVATIAATGAAVLLVRKSTEKVGLRWHNIVGWCWAGLIFACAVGLHTEDYIRNLLFMSAIFAPFGALWAITGCWVRRFLAEENTTPISPVVPATPNVADSAVATVQAPLAASQHFTRQTAPLVAGRRY